MKPKLKVFLSSAQFENEFELERQSLPVFFKKQPLVSSFCLWKIEDNASPNKIEEHYKRNVNDSDILLLLLGDTLRDAVKNEFKEAKLKNKRIFAFLKASSKRSSQMESFIQEVRNDCVTAEYSSFNELVDKIEDSFFEYYLRGSKDEEVKKWKDIHEERSIPEERTLRLITGVLGTSKTKITKKKVLQSLILEVLSIFDGAVSKEKIISSIYELIKTKSIQLKDEIINELNILRMNNSIQVTNNGKFSLSKNLLKQISSQVDQMKLQDDQLMNSLYNIFIDNRETISRSVFQKIVGNTISQFVYDVVFDMAEQEFGNFSNPFSLDSDEINRMIVKILSKEEDVLIGGLTGWQTTIVSIIESKDENIILWLNKLRKSYWALAVLGVDPDIVEYTTNQMKKYCIYFDSHIVIRALVGAGDGSKICKDMLRLGKDIGVEMRISYSLFNEIKQAIDAANKAYYAAREDVLLARDYYNKLHRKSDVFDGYLNSLNETPGLSWEDYVNRFYSLANENKLKSYLKNELGITVQDERNFSEKQLGQIEYITSQLLECRKKTISPPNHLSVEEYKAWEKQYLLRQNEARQMAIIYELRKERDNINHKIWFVTYDTFVYEVSSSLVAGSDDFYKFPCYMKPGTWLNILLNSSTTYIPINTFREILLSTEFQYVADQVESEVITQMLKSRVDKGVSSINSLRNMFDDLINRPAIKEAYNEVLKAEGIKSYEKMNKVKDQVIEEIQKDLIQLENKNKDLSSKIAKATHEANKEHKKAKYYKRQMNRAMRHNK